MGGCLLNVDAEFCISDIAMHSAKTPFLRIVIKMPSCHIAIPTPPEGKGVSQSHCHLPRTGLSLLLNCSLTKGGTTQNVMSCYVKENHITKQAP